MKLSLKLVCVHSNNKFHPVQGTTETALQLQATTVQHFKVTAYDLNKLGDLCNCTVVISAASKRDHLILRK